ncbi:MAG: hypothetical protein OEW09_12255 [Anaerolineae bacterium]|nr:hypothetical protein [Anaerolineae bacterium]
MTRKFAMFFGLALALSSGPAMAASISNLSGQSCGAAEGTWHFVNNQTGGAAAGTLTATWASGDTCTVGPSKVLGSTQHFYCQASGALTGASTDLPGKLVLSDFSCETSKCVPDPKGEICGDKIDNDCDGKIDEDCKP